MVASCVQIASQVGWQFGREVFVAELRAGGLFVQRAATLQTRAGGLQSIHHREGGRGTVGRIFL